MLGRLCFKYLNAIIVSGNPIYSKEYIYTIKLYSELDLNVCMVNGVSFLKKYEIVFLFLGDRICSRPNFDNFGNVKKFCLVYIFKSHTKMVKKI